MTRNNYTGYWRVRALQNTVSVVCGICGSKDIVYIFFHTESLNVK